VDARRVNPRVFLNAANITVAVLRYCETEGGAGPKLADAIDCGGALGTRQVLWRHVVKCIVLYSRVRVFVFV